MRYLFPLASLLAAAFLLHGCMDAVKGDYARQRGNIAYLRDLDYAAAVPRYQEAMAANDSEAYYRMGMMILEGAAEGSQQQGIGYVTTAADRGSVDAQSFLGRALLSGAYGVKKDGARALGYLDRAAAGGDDLALHSLALAYAGAFDVPRDPARAAACNRQLAGMGWNIPEVLKSEAAYGKTKKLRPGRQGVFTTKLTQEYLNKLGYKAGPPNGALSKATQSAIRRFQRDAGRRETGKPSMALLRELHQAVVDKFF
ncbi:MAG: SEL1-like repeat protein [Mailhella sp.]|nr:SEL1-like repeat protein [Mailhella sp.]